MGKVKYKNPAKIRTKRIRKIARSGSRMPSPKDEKLANDTIGKGHSESGTSLLNIKKTGRGKRDQAIVGHTSQHYDPAFNIAKNIQRALDPNSHENRVYPVEQTGASDAAGTKVRGKILKTTDRGGAQVLVYGVKVWLKEKWVRAEDSGIVWISNSAFNKSRFLQWARRRHRERVSEMIKNR